MMSTVANTAPGGDHQEPDEQAPIKHLDLSGHNVIGHFAQATKDVHFLKFLMSLDHVDRWAVDYEKEFGKQSFEIKLLLEEIQQFVDTSAQVLHLVPKEFADVISYLTTSRCMYLLRFVAHRNELFVDALGDVLDSQATGSVAVGTLKRRLEAFAKARMLGEIFSGARLTRITRIMGSYTDV